MISSRELPNHADLKPYNHAVAGHDGTLCDPDGELFIKPCVQQEIDFYEKAFKDHQNFADLMPEFYGVLTLNDATDHDPTKITDQLPHEVVDHMSQHLKDEAIRMATEHAAKAAASAAAGGASPTSKVTGRKIATDKSVVLENAAYGFKHPNILDAKLGQRLWADDAAQEKKDRFDKITAETTNGSHGFRIAGMRAWRGSDNEKEWDQEGYKVYDKDFGRFEVNKNNITQTLQKFIFNPKAGIDEDLGKAVATAFLNDLKRVEQVLSSVETRMYSASLLFTFEGDGEVLRKNIEQQTAILSTPEPSRSAGNGSPGLAHLQTSRVDSGIVLDGDGEIVNTKEAAESDDEYDFASLPKIYSLKLIDFAHATWVPGQGPDQNSLIGVRSLIKIFEELGK
ncbi:hypothetical protein QBC38DRAFT_478530 [Podospora fimiseda]|uniref:Kinase n=1 Tax=Podospora fimiseda TaxID=252190 RepID=A0AAN7BPR0_9PEZI|nr:hypothetical protein QBC38DRAFT_478530 [Podospora fimiseda]